MSDDAVGNEKVRVEQKHYQLVAISNFRQLKLKIEIVKFKDFIGLYCAFF